MALITTGLITGGAAGAKALGISGGDVAGFFGFGGGGGKDRRRQIREQLSSVGFIYNNNHPDAWNINKFGDQALENVVKLYEQYGDVAIQLHNNRELSDTIASNYSRLTGLAESRLSAGRNTENLPGGNPADPAGSVQSEWLPWGLAAFAIIGLFGFFFVK